MESILAFAYAAISIYWTLGGTFLLNTVGGSIENIARQGGLLAYMLGIIAVVSKIIVGLLALALVRPFGSRFPRKLLVVSAVAISIFLISYGGLMVVAGSLVLLGIVQPGSSVDWTALRWHVLVWDMWFLLLGVLMALAIMGYRKRTEQPSL